MAPPLPLVLSIILILIILCPGPDQFAKGSRTFTISNGCKETIWPGITPGDTFSGGGFMLKPGESRVFTASVGWSGRIWGRTGCNFDKNGIGKCQTGACGSNLKCTASGDPPATLAEFTLASPDFYDVSLVDGFNVPMAVKAVHSQGGNCSTAGCDSDLRLNCPKELSVKVGSKTVSCRSACDVFNTDEYCCRGLHGNPSTCQPSYYSKLFKVACPSAYSYAYDDPTSIFTCSGTDYIITFCTPRKEKQCTYHDHRLVCSGSKGVKPLIKMWWTVMMVSLPLIMMITTTIPWGFS